MNILIFVFVSLVFVPLRSFAFRKQVVNCGKPLYVIPKRTYKWHILGPLVIYSFMLMAVYTDLYKSLSLVSGWMFAILAGFLAGICLMIAFIYFFTQAGIYENGILTHFLYIELNQILNIEFANENSLNINPKIKTLKLNLRMSTVKLPSIEYFELDEPRIKDALKKLNILER